jgi:hypothetical protein
MLQELADHFWLAHGSGGGALRAKYPFLEKMARVAPAPSPALAAAVAAAGQAEPQGELESVMRHVYRWAYA